MGSLTSWSSVCKVTIERRVGWCGRPGIVRNFELHRDACGRVRWSWDCTQSPGSVGQEIMGEIGPQSYTLYQDCYLQSKGNKILLRP